MLRRLKQRQPIPCQIDIPSTKPRNRTVALIDKAETKGHSKKQIITFLKKKGVTASKIIESYSQYYAENGLYEISFDERPLGFSVIKGDNGKNAIISTIQNHQNVQKGMKIASSIYDINGKRVYDAHYGHILKEFAQQKTPFYVTFREPQQNDAQDNEARVHHHHLRKKSCSSSTSNGDCSDCSPYLATNEQATMQLSPSVSPLIGIDVYSSPADDDMEELHLSRAYTFGHNDIQKELKKDSRISSCTTQILLLGCNHSGKSTIMKQLKMIYGNGYSDKEKLKFISDIHQFIVQQMQSLVTLVDTATKLSTKALKVKQYLDTISASYYLDYRASSSIQYLWNQASIKDLYERNKSRTKLSGNAAYFWNEMNRVTHRNYMPSMKDILMLPSTATRVIEEKYTLNNTPFNVINMGGQRSDWKKWIECFSNVDIAVFVASLDCYDAELENYADVVMHEYIERSYLEMDIPEDVTGVILKYCIELGVASKNAMDEQMVFWKKICNHPSLKDTQIVLCLNKYDLFYQRAKQTPISVCPSLKGYYGSLRSTDSMIEYIRDCFFYKDRQHASIDCWYMTGTDHNSVRRNFNERIRQLMKPPTLTVREIN
eukprot:118332_1